jgi:hypothetical protein
VIAAGAVIGIPVGVVFCLIFLGQATQQQLCGTQTGPVSAAGEPPLVQYYIAAANRYQLGTTGYAYLAGINDAETTFGTNLAVSSAGAIGWMQFEPDTFKEWAVDVTDPSGGADPYDPQDAIYTAARYLHASGAPSDWPHAIFTYNHSAAYVAEVQGFATEFSGANGLANLRAAIAAAWGGRQPTGLPKSEPVSYNPGATSGGCCAGQAATPTAMPAGSTSTAATAAAPGPTPPAPSVTTPAPAPAAPVAGGCGGLRIDVTPVPGPVAVILPNGLARPPASAPAPVQAMVAAGDRINHMDYQWGGGHADLPLSDSPTNPQPQGGDQPGDDGTPGYDCSGSTAYVLSGGGFESYFGGPGGSIPVSGSFGSFGEPGNGRWVTWYYNAGHVFIEVAGIVFDTGHQFPAQPSTPSTGPRWTIAADVAAQQTGDGPFSAQHPAGL